MVHFSNVDGTKPFTTGVIYIPSKLRDFFRHFHTDYGPETKPRLKVILQSRGSCTIYDIITIDNNDIWYFILVMCDILHFVFTWKKRKFYV